MTECVRLPLVPVTVSVRVPVVALLPTATDKVELPEPVTDVGLSVVVTREPCPVTLRVTAPENPFNAAMVTVALPVEPRVTVMLAGESVMVKSALGALTVKAIVVVWVMPPPLAVMVTVDVPVAAVLLAVKVRVELPLPGAAIVAGLNDAVTPEGRPETVSDTAELNPPLTLVEMELVAVPPWVRLTVAGEAARVKAGVADCQTSVIGVALAAEPACVRP